MTIWQWIEKENKTIYWLENQLGYKHGYMYQIRDGRFPVSKRMADKIHELTKGEVDMLEHRD